MASILSSYGSEKPDQTVGGSSKPSSTMTEQKDEKFVLGRKGFLVFFTLAVLTLMAALDGTSLSVALPVSFVPCAILLQLTFPKTIAQALNGTAIEAFWSGTSFLLASTGTGSLFWWV